MTIDETLPEQIEDKDYYEKDGYLYARGRVLCGICSRDMGKSENEEGQLSYCGCENEVHYNDY